VMLELRAESRPCLPERPVSGRFVTCVARTPLASWMRARQARP